jgi:dienelactone hydrolase
MVGHNDYARKRADMLASLGYTVMAVDMYGDGKQADHPKDLANLPVQYARTCRSPRHASMLHSMY